MNIRQAFPSIFLKAADLGETKPRAIIENCEMITLDSGDEKPILRFENKKQGLVLNKTNAAILSKAFGDETDTWRGKSIVLYVAKVQFKSDMVDAIRVDADQPAEPATSQDSLGLGDESAHDVPF